MSVRCTARTGLLFTAAEGQAFDLRPAGDETTWSRGTYTHHVTVGGTVFGAEEWVGYDAPHYFLPCDGTVAHLAQTASAQRLHPATLGAFIILTIPLNQACLASDAPTSNLLGLGAFPSTPGGQSVGQTAAPPVEPST